MTFRLHSRLIFWNVVIIGLVVGILAYFLSSSLRDHIEGEIEERLTHETTLAAIYLAQASPDANLDSLADKLGDLLDVRTTIIAHDGKVLGDSELNAAELQTVENHKSRPEVLDAEDHGTGMSVRWSPTVKVEFIYVARKLDPYVVRLAMPLSTIDTLMGALWRQLAIAATIALGITLGFGYLVRGLISQPLRRIATVSTQLAAGDLDQRLPISGDEEIAALGNSLNTMAKNLSSQLNALSEGKQRLELIVGAMSEGVMVLDSSGRISLANRALRDLTGWERDLIGRTPLEVFRVSQIDEALRNAMQAGVSYVIEMTIGNARTIQANVAPVANAAGVVDSVVIVFHDLTDIRRTEKMRRDFVANVSHEFKTPLTSIKGYAETLLSGAVDDPEIAPDFLRTIERNAKHLEALVTDLLTLARLEAEMPASLESIDLKSIVDDQLSLRKALIRERRIRVRNECPSIEVVADRQRLSTAIANLVDNAIYYNKPDGEIVITGRTEERTVLLSISDTGVGIPAGEIDRVFERFYRVDKARSREFGRTGLGLSIVKHAIESQGGSIHVSSVYGSGSTFTISLPLRRL